MRDWQKIILKRKKDAIITTFKKLHYKLHAKTMEKKNQRNVFAIPIWIHQQRGYMSTRDDKNEIPMVTAQRTTAEKHSLMRFSKGLHNIIGQS